MEQVAESYAQQCQILKFLGFDMASIHLCYRSQMPTKFLSRSPTTAPTSTAAAWKTGPGSR